MTLEQAFASAQRGGLASAQGLMAAGVSASGITKAARTGRLRRVARGLYAQGIEVHQLERLARLGVLSHSTAAELHGFPLLRPAGRHLTVGHHPRWVPAGTRVHRDQLGDEDVTTIGSCRVTSPLRTALDCAASMAAQDAVVLLDHVLHQRVVQHSTLIRRATARRGPGSARLRRHVGQADALAESPLETLARLAFRAAGLDPELQVVITDCGEFVARVDFLLRAAHLVIEADGYEFHADPVQFQTDRARQNALVALGFRVVRFTWDDINERPDSAVALVRRILASSGVASSVVASSVAAS